MPDLSKVTAILPDLTDYVVYGAIAIVTLIGLFKCLIPLWRTTASLRLAISRLQQNAGKQLDKPVWQEARFVGRRLKGSWLRFLQNAEQLDRRGLPTNVEDYINDDTVTHGPGNAGLAELIPNLLTSLGILGTFMGLSRGLSSLNFADSAQLIQGIPDLLSGMRFAFGTSVAGISCSLVFNMLNRISQGSSYRAIDDFVTSFTQLAMSRPLDNDVQLIIQNNPVDPEQSGPRKLGPKICVPFGKTLRGVLVPNCVTKDLNTEKLYDIDMESFTIKEFPHYAPLKVQIRTIKSFMRPVILVDDLYHKGYRLQAVEKVMKGEDLKLNKLIVGVCSGRGNDLANVLEEPIESVYFVPNMRSWLIESDLYPFIGGDGIRVKEQIHSSPSLPSVNSILPYQFPSFMKGASMEAFYNLSVVCLENARSIFLVLEKLYQDKYGRKLTMSRIGEVLAEPRHPDTCILDTSVVQESPSLLLTREMQKLHRLKHLLDGEFRM